MCNEICPKRPANLYVDIFYTNIHIEYTKTLLYDVKQLSIMDKNQNNYNWYCFLINYKQNMDVTKIVRNVPGPIFFENS
jgi:hypothetical protein